MKNIKAMLVAFILFLITVTIIKTSVNQDISGYSLQYGTWIEPSKFASNKALKILLGSEKSIAVFGSSELKHSQNTGFHADTIYQDSDMEPVFIGKGGYQSLNHAITLGAIGDTLKGRKVVLSVSPQWFKDTGVQKTAFGASYSESNFIAFLQNKDISDETKRYVIDRIQTLTNENPAMWDKIQQDVNWYLKDENNWWQNLRKGIHSYLAEEKTEMKLFLNAKRSGIGSTDDEMEAKDSDKEINWKKYYKKAIKKGQKKTGHNDLGMLDRVYERRYKERVRQNSFQKPAYSVESIEFQDVECFLKICKEENIEVMMIMLPFNGRWCDYLKLTQDQRKGFYDRVRSIAKENGVQLEDMSGFEYSDYIFEDDSHLALKGLVTFNEKIYNFYRQVKK